VEGEIKDEREHEKEKKNEKGRKLKKQLLPALFRKRHPKNNENKEDNRRQQPGGEISVDRQSREERGEDDKPAGRAQVSARAGGGSPNLSLGPNQRLGYCFPKEIERERGEQRQQDGAEAETAEVEMPVGQGQAEHSEQG
jgi:hypothetical protein